ncbi:MAG: hypothetical protein ACYTDY_15365 [Planctomycetota bacterium]|jgi:hypothetical protein
MKKLMTLVMAVAMTLLPFDLAFGRGGRGRGGGGGRMGGGRIGGSRMSGGSRSDKKQRERDWREDGKTYRIGLENDRV